MLWVDKNKFVEKMIGEPIKSEIHAPLVPARWFGDTPQSILRLPR